MKQNIKRILFAGRVYGLLENEVEDTSIDLEICKYIDECQSKPNVKSCRHYQLCRSYKFYERYGEDWRMMGI